MLDGKLLQESNLHYHYTKELGSSYGTRTRAARVKGEYPSHLVCRGKEFEVPTVGVEPTTTRLKVLRSTD